MLVFLSWGNPLSPDAMKHGGFAFLSFALNTISMHEVQSIFSSWQTAWTVPPVEISLLLLPAPPPAPLPSALQGLQSNCSLWNCPGTQGLKHPSFLALASRTLRVKTYYLQELLPSRTRINPPHTHLHTHIRWSTCLQAGENAG